MRSVALLLPLLLACGAPLFAQDTPPNAPVADTQPLHRSPATARILGTLIPGGGHVYAGEYAKGVRYYYGTVSGIGGGALTYAVSGFAPTRARQLPLQVTGVLMVGVGIGVWVHSSLDAPRAAARANAKHNRSPPRLSPVLRSDQSATQRVDLGMSISW